jgi:hypothetical protein
MLNHGIRQKMCTIATIACLGIALSLFLAPSLLMPCPVPDVVSCGNDVRPIHPPPRMNASCPITWVTAYFRTPSKHSLEEYSEWIRNMQAIDMCLVVYTDSLDLWSTPSTTIVIPTNLCSVASYHLNLTMVEWQMEFSMDPECHIHQHYQLYWVWALKAFFLNATAVADPFGSENFFWIDSGYFRDHSQDGLDIRATRTSLVRAGAVAFTQINPFTQGELDGFAHGEVDGFAHGKLNIFTAGLHDRLAGNLFGGDAVAVQSWCERYKGMLAFYHSKVWFIGKDQTVMTSTCMETPELCQRIVPNPLILGTKINPWFFLFESITTTVV